MVIELVAMLWWTIAVVLIMSFIMSDLRSSNKDTVLAFALCLSWPFFLPFGTVWLLYSFFVKSTKQLRNDIENRGLLREFEEFLKERKHGKILPKEDNDGKDY
jgi:hypothetical protein